MLNDVAREGAADLLGLRHYPGYYFAPTRLNPADAPTRKREIRRNRLAPGFLAAAARGDFEGFDCWAALPMQQRTVSTWARFYVRLAFPETPIPWPWR